MLGAVFGDIVGSAYEWNNVKTKDFPLERPGTRYTDDSVMTLAVAKWLLEDPSHSESHLIKCMQKLGRGHIRAGYGGRFKEWLLSEDPQPYNSWGNGSAMRVSPVGLYADSVEEARELARISASVTHNHPEGIKGAMAVAECVFLNKNRRNGSLSNRAIKGYIKAMIQKEYGYDLQRKLDEIRPNYTFDVSCQGSVPEAIIAFLESETLEDCVRNAVSLGGDSDTIAAIACSIFAANKDGWDVLLMSHFTKYLPGDLRTIQDKFEELVFPRKPICNREYTPERITELKPNEIFVFGSNLAGSHGGGAARLAYNRFGAIWGQGVGLQGQSYAIPTMQGGVETIKPYVDEFIEFAKQHPEYKFLVTKIGCGIAGFATREIAPLFDHALDVENVILPKEFVEMIND